jgi:gluconate:H+ symporter, GntP family
MNSRRFLNISASVLVILFGGAILIGQEGASDGDQETPTTASPSTSEETAGDATVGDAADGETHDERADVDVDESVVVVVPLSPDGSVARPLLILLFGVAIVLGLIIVLKVNAFLALVVAAIFVSFCAPGEMGDKVERVARAFGSTAGGIGIVIALASIIGKCMLDSGAADRVVRFFVGFMGERRAPLALMGSGYVLAIPVFFDTVFYLLVPLARSLHRRTKTHYLKYILAIAAGGAITHTLVPPTPGPLLMATTLEIDLGLMIMIGVLVALPAAAAGLVFATLADAVMKTPMRPLGSEPEPAPLEDHQLPSLLLSVLPVALPVALISLNTLVTTLADMEGTSRVTASDLREPEFREALSQEDSLPVARVREFLSTTLLEQVDADAGWTDEQRREVMDELNELLQKKDFHREADFVGLVHQEATRKLLDVDRERLRRAELEHLNRLLLEESLNTESRVAIEPHDWLTARRRAAELTSVIGNANFALLLSTLIAIWTLARQRQLSRIEIADVIEKALMSGGVIILITSGGGAFGQMLKTAEIGEAIKIVFGTLLQDAESGMVYLLMGFLLAAVLKIAQGSSTVAMIVGSSMMAAIIDRENLAFNPVYLAMAIGGGSLIGSWMNDSGFWIFAKMGGLTETEALKSWTLMLLVLGTVSFLMAVALSVLLPLTGA